MTAEAASVFVQVYATLLVAIVFTVRFGPSVSMRATVILGALLGLVVAEIGFLLFAVATNSPLGTFEIVFTIGTGLILGLGLLAAATHSMLSGDR